MKSWKLSMAVWLTLCAGLALARAQQQSVNPGNSPAAKPRITNARLQELQATSGLRATVDGLAQKQPGPLWIGYRIPAAGKERTLCCFNSVDSMNWQKSNCCMGCRVESGKGGSGVSGVSGVSSVSFNGTVDHCSPEPLPYAFVFLRVEERKIGKVRVYSPDCALDFANLPVYWLEQVKPEESVELLTGLALAESSEAAGEKKRPERQAVMAIAMHDTPAADAALEKMVQPGQRASLREDVAFWLGVERGQRGVELLRKYIKEDPDERVREKGTFAFSQSKEPEGLKELIGMARHDSSPRVRGQAIFWLAQVGSRKEGAQITEAIENDPNTEVKKKAVFALSQMHDPEAVPRLINVARTNKNPVVRKQAIFWLGQMNDPRALDYLEEILTK